MIYTVIVLKHQLVACYGTKARCRAALVGGNLSDSACLLCGHFVGITSTRINRIIYTVIVPNRQLVARSSWQTNCSIPSRVSSLGFSSRLAKDLRIDTLASSNYFQQVGFPFAEKVPVLSAPVKA